VKFLSPISLGFVKPFPYPSEDHPVRRFGGAVSLRIFDRGEALFDI